MALSQPLTGSCTALVTPFTDDASQSLNKDSVLKLIDLQLSSGTSALVPCGTTGETPTLSDAEWEFMVTETVKRAKGSGVSVIAGTGSNSTKKAVQLTSKAQELGADACLVVTPYYNKPTPQGLLGHFRELNKVGIPLVLYNVPGRTGQNVPPDLFIKIAEECENVISLKAANGNLDEMMEVCYRSRSLPQQISILSGDDSITLPILSIGGTGVISVIANVMPKTMALLVRSFLDGQIETSREYSFAIHKFASGLLKIGSNPCAVKYSMQAAGFEVGSPRLPLSELTEEQKSAVRDLMAGTVSNLKKAGLDFDDHLKSLF